MKLYIHHLTTNCKTIALLIVVLFFAACKNGNENIPFPSDEAGFAKPVSKPFKLSEPKKIDWIVTNTDTLKLPPPRRIDFDKIPSRPFYPDGFHPLVKPMDKKTFDLSTLPDTAFNYDDLPAEPLRFKTYRL